MSEAGPALHVLMVLDGAYLPREGGGTELQVRTIAQALRKRGHRVTIVAPLIRAAASQRIARIDHTPVVRLPFPDLPVIGGLWLMARLFLFLLSRRNKYDVWHAHSPRRLAAVAALLGSWLRKPRVVIKIANAGEFDTGALAPQSSLLNRVLSHCVRRADGWQAISSQIVRGLEAKGIPADRICAIPNAVDVSRFDPLPAPAADHTRFLFIGRLVPAKNLFMLLKAFAAALQARPEIQLRIVGGGRLEGALKHTAQTLGIARSVEFTGYRADVAQLLAQADIGVLPSTSEGLSNTLLESMARGLPMIASRISGNEDFVHNGINGWLFEADDCEGLTRCLIEAASLSAPQRAELGAAGRATIERYASADSVPERLLEMYRGTAASAPRAAAALSEGV